MTDPIKAMLPKSKEASSIVGEMKRQCDELAKAVETANHATVMTMAECAKAMRAQTKAVEDSIKRVADGMSRRVPYEVVLKRNDIGLLESAVLKPMEDEAI